MLEPRRMEAGGLQLTVRLMTSHDLGQLIALTSSALWQVTLDDLKVMWQADPDGFIGAFLDDGTLICHISMILHSDKLAYLGLYITSTPYRGRGIGKKVFQCATDLAAHRTFVLDSVLEEVSLYEKIGFRFADIRIEHISGTTDRDKLYKPSVSGSTFKEVTAENIDAVVKFDSVIFPGRTNLTTKWLVSENSRSLAAIDSMSGEVLGYIVVRPDHVTASPNSFKICGLYANDTTAALCLMQRALQMLPDKSRVWSEFPSRNRGACLHIYNQLGMNTINEEWTLHKMVRGSEDFPSLDWPKIFAGTQTYTTFT